MQHLARASDYPMIYSFVCTLLRFILKFAYPKVKLLYLDRLPKDKPYIIVCRHSKSRVNALILAAYLGIPLYFIQPYRKPFNLLSRLLMNALHIVPLRRGWHKLPDQTQPASPWSNLRWLITQNLPAVFFTENENGQLQVPKGAAKIALHTEEVFDFSLGVELIPIHIQHFDHELTLTIEKGIRIAEYQRSYQHYPARTVRDITNRVQKTLSRASGGKVCRPFGSLNKKKPTAYT